MIKIIRDSDKQWCIWYN